jgi:hypothetical protein
MIQIVVKKGRYNAGFDFFVENEIFSMSESVFNSVNIQNLVREGVLAKLEDEMKTEIVDPKFVNPLKESKDDTAEIVCDPKETQKELVVEPDERKELFELDKDEQVDILKGLGVKRIPRLEPARVDLILKLKKEAV